MSIPSFSEWPPIPQRSAPEADFDAKMYALFQHFAVTHRNEMLAFISFLESNSTVIGAALNATTIGLTTPAAGKFTTLLADSLGGGAVQSDGVDGTAGRLMMVGAFGLGSRDSTAIVVSDGHADLPAGFYAGGGGGAVNFPPNANYRPFLNLTRRIGTNDYRQVRFFFGAGNVPIVRYSDDKGVTWQDENTLYGMRNILGTVSQSAGVPTGAVIERGSNANGEYVRFADGTQICSIHRLASITTSTEGSLHRSDTNFGVWAYPASFVSTPAVFANIHASKQWAQAGISSSVQLAAVVVWSSEALTASGRDIRAIAIGRWY